MSETPADPSEAETPRREFKFKPTEFERANRSLDEADNLSAVDVRALIHQAGGASINGPAKSAPPAENEVHAILRANLAEANDAGDNDLELIERRTTKRMRDYWALLIGGNLVLGGSALLGASNVVVLSFSLAGIVLYSLGLTWIMWFVMDSY
ncbi:MAG: hypothetical protein JWM32_165 [Verrucomicrobia bacterium]|nr:hypothetical protein [Verrucomicrobiota bacterium]